MKRVLGICALLLFGSSAQGLAQRPLELGVAAGIAAPAGSLNRAFGLGLGIEGFAEKQFSSAPISFGATGAYRLMPASNTWHMSVASFETSARYSFATLALSPSIVIGPGLYTISEKATGVHNGVPFQRSETNHSWGGFIGGGLLFSRAVLRAAVRERV